MPRISGSTSATAQGTASCACDNLADISRGFTSGADKFYSVRDVTEEWLSRLADASTFRERWAIDPEQTEAFRIVRDGEGGDHIVEARFLEPEFHTPMEAKSIVIRSADVKRLVINAPISRAALRNTKLADYVAHAERLGWNRGPTVESRGRTRPWYDLGLRAKVARAQMFWPKSQQYRHIVTWNEDKLPANDNLYDLWALEDVDPRLLWAMLNSTIVALSKHQFGRAAGIEGNFKTEVIDVEMMLVPDVRRAPPDMAARAVAAAERMARGLSGRKLPEEFESSDRRELDDAVLEMLGFPDAAERATFRDSIYEALRELYRSTRAREIIAQADRRRTARRGRITATDIADEIWAEHADSFGLLRFPEDFLLRPSQGDLVDLPPGPVEVGTALMDTGRGLRAGTVRVGGRTGTVIEAGSVPRAQFLEALALCGHHGAVRVPNDRQCEEALRQFNDYRQGLADRFEALAAERTRDPRRQHAISAALIRKALWIGSVQE